MLFFFFSLIHDFLKLEYMLIKIKFYFQMILKKHISGVHIYLIFWNDNFNPNPDKSK